MNLMKDKAKLFRGLGDPARFQVLKSSAAAQEQ
jgi:hypothetical protein